MQYDTWPAFRVERRPVCALKPAKNNARTHSPEQVAQIASSIREWGWTQPVLVDEEGGVIAGHGRLLAAKSLGVDEVPVIVAAGWSEAQKRAYLIADNQLALNAGWDRDLLRVELGELAELSFDTSLLGFDAAFVTDVMADRRGGLTDPDAVPEPPTKPVSRPGDLWHLGDHRLLCGDATVLADVEKVLDGNAADMCFTDSPYNVDYGATKKRGSDRRMLNDALGDGFEAFLYDASLNILTVTRGAVYMCMSSSELHTLQKAFVAAGGHWSTFIIWAKNTFTLGRSDYQRQFEPILYGWKEGDKHHWCGARDQGDVWFVDKPARNDLHPTMKPVELVKRAIGNSSQRGGVVLDPFGGSGTTLIACEQTGRHARLVELDPKYCDVICKRWLDHSGGSARLDGTDDTFNDQQAGRV
ncbi:MAG: site-specific DNA-methyltransferase [Alphaproteobacteria bacterium]|nr:site-specific DNA-methyltransferase [Alphaproteobacteria bacterium]